MKKRVGIFSPYGLWTVHSQVEAILGAAVAQRGAEVVTLLCHGFLKRCPLVRGDQPSAEYCDRCHAEAEKMFDSLGVSSLKIGSSITPQQRSEIKSWVEQLPDDELWNATYSEVNLGQFMVVTLHSIFASGTIDLKNSRENEIYRSYIHSAALIELEMKQFVDTYRPDSMICFSGLPGFHRVMMAVCARRGVRVLVHERALVDGAFAFHENENIMTVDNKVRDFEEWKSVPLLEIEIERLKKYFAQRERGKLGSLDFSFISYRDDDIDVRRMLRLPHDASIVTFFLSSEHEIAINRQHIGPAFESQLDGLRAVVDFFADRPEYLVIKAHPAHHPDTDFFSNCIQLAPSLPSNVRFLFPKEKLSPYSLMRNSTAVISYGSTAGIEALARGVPVCSLFPNHYSAVDSGIEPVLEQNSLDPALRRMLARGQSVGVDDMIRAYRAMYFVFFHLSERLESVGIRNGSNPDIRISSAGELAPSQDAALDRLCGFLLEGKTSRRSPTREELTRDESEERRVIEAEWMALNAQRQALLPLIKQRAESFSEPEITCLRIQKESVDRSSPDFPSNLLSSVARSRHRAIQHMEMIHKPSMGTGAFLDELGSALQGVSTDFVYVAPDTMSVSERLFSYATDCLTQEGAAIFLSGVWLFDEDGNIVRELFTEGYEGPGKYDFCHRGDNLGWVLENESAFSDVGKLFGCFVWRRTELIAFVDSVRGCEDARSLVRALINRYVRSRFLAGLRSSLRRPRRLKDVAKAFGALVVSRQPAAELLTSMSPDIYCNLPRNTSTHPPSDAAGQSDAGEYETSTGWRLPTA